MFKRRTQRIIKTTIFIFFVTFLWIQTHVNYLTTSATTRSTHIEDEQEGPNRNQLFKETPADQNETSFNVTYIKSRVDFYNSLETVHNIDLYGPLWGNSTVIVVQVHKRHSVTISKDNRGK